MLKSMSRMVMLALAAGVMWSCDGERATQPKPLGKVAADGSAVVVVTVQAEGAPVSGVVVELSRSIAGVAASYEWSATTDENGQARIEVSSSGYYQARVVQDGSEVGYKSSIPLNVGTEVPLSFAIAALGPSANPRDVTRAYVAAAIARYERDGQEAMLAYYNSLESVEGERVMFIVSSDDHTILAWATNPAALGNSTFTAPGTPIGSVIALATPEGHWSEIIGEDRETGQEVPKLRLAVRHDGLIFMVSHSITRDDREAFTQDYVNRAIAFYQSNGLEATIAYYDSRESVDGQFYLFLIGVDDIYLAHPIFPHLKDTDIKDVTDTTGYELGEEIAKATEEGHWVDYLWPNPVTQVPEPKSAWVMRHDGLIFASGYYTPDPNAEPPAWQDADPETYTETYVKNAIARYKRDGLESMKAYYNSVVSFEGEWYLFVADANANDTYIVHPLFPYLVGTDIKDVKSSDNPDLGRQIAEATEEGAWVNYLWPHPLTLQEVPKRAYAERYDGLVFASGYHPPQVEDPRTHTRAYVAEAIEYYKSNGRDATVEHYNNPLSADGVWYLVLLDVDFKILTHILFGNIVGQDARVVLPALAPDFPLDELVNIAEEGQWLQYTVFNPNTAETDVTYLWIVRHDGLYFASAYLASE